MYYFIFIFLFIILIGYLLFEKLMAITFRFDSEENNINAHLKWLSPFLKAEVKMFNFKPFITVFLLALGLGAKLCTEEQNVSILPMNAAGSQIIDKIPQILNGMKQNGQPAAQ